MASSQPKRLVEYSLFARADLAENYAHTAYHWGEKQAASYADFLHQKATSAANGEILSKPVQDHEPTRAIFAKWPKARYGHYIFFRVTDEGIFVLRILHSAMDLPSHLEAQ